MLTVNTAKTYIACGLRSIMWNRQTVDGAWYCTMLEDEFKATICINAKEYWQMELFCIITMLHLIWKQQPLKGSENLNLSFSPTEHKDQTLPNLITIFLDQSKMHYVDTNLHMMQRSRTKCISENILHRWQMESRSLCT